MKVIEKIVDLQRALVPHRNNKEAIGFVPTMGALHNGHAQLVKQCVHENDVTVVSIFVNPTQFNNEQDLVLYPRTPDADYNLLQEIGVDYIFAPLVQEMYPEPDTRSFDFGALSNVMEGHFRPGHFNGVAQVVSKLFDIVKASKAYFGEKDFQQLAIVRNMVQQMGNKIEIVGVPIVREQNGLAMSSRNQRLTAQQRITAAKIYATLQKSKEVAKSHLPQHTIDFVVQNINNIDGLSVEYYDIVNSITLQPINKWTDAEEIVGCIAVFCGDVRLIDNIRYK